MQWLLVCSQICAAINTVHFKTFTSPQKEANRWNTEDVYSSQTVPYSSGYCDGGYMSKCMECTTPVNPKCKLFAVGGNDQYMFVYCNRPSGADVDYGRSACVWQGVHG